MSDISFDYSILYEKELVGLLKCGEKKAFEQLYHNYKGRLYGNLLKMVKSDEIAEELLQDLFVKIWTSRDSIDPDKSFRSYLFKIAENLVYDFFRKAALNKKLQSYLVSVAVESVSPIEQNLYYKEGKSVLEKAIGKLPPKRKQIYILCKMEGRSYAEVSRLLGVSTSTINEHIVKASRIIKRHF
jgi:RNA polymerase sigma-70 factor (family 1)